MMNWIVFSLGNLSCLTAEERGLVITASKVNLGEILTLPDEPKKLTVVGKIFASLLPNLVEQGIAVPDQDGSLVITPQKLEFLVNPPTPEADYGLERYLPPVSPFVLDLRNEGTLGTSDLRFDVRFFLGAREVYPERRGVFLQRGDLLYRLEQAQYELIEAIEDFNALDADQKYKERNLREFAVIKALALQSEATLHPALENENVVLPQQVSIEIFEVGNEQISVRPGFAGIEAEVLHKEFLRYGEAQDIYDLPDGAGGRLRVVLNEDIRLAVQHMRQNLTRLSGAKRDEMISSPQKVFATVCPPEVLDLSNFGPRVKEIGPYAFKAQPFIRGYHSDFLGMEAGLTAQDADGNPVVINIPDLEALANIEKKIATAEHQNRSSISVTDQNGCERIIFFDTALKAGLKQISEAFLEKQTTDDNAQKAEKPKSENVYVLIYENEETISYQEQTGSASRKLYEQPKALKPQITLKAFQRDAVAWLQANFTSQLRRGQILADDMGMGKTLSVLTFLAWCIEKKFILSDKPILVVAPVILLDNWKKEIQRFFVADGVIFDPVLILYGRELEKLRLKNFGKKEYELGEATLNLEKIVRNRLIITNYDTIKNYQFSLCQVEWSVIVADEAQAIKDEKTVITLAMKALNSRFRISMTGTPIENRLLDLWCLMDFVQPGLLGASKTFSRTWETKLTDDTERQHLLEKLKRTLRLDHPTEAFVLARQKEDYLGNELPRRHTIRLECSLSNDQLQRHRAIIQALSNVGNARIGQHLKALQDLYRLYEHPSLLTDAALGHSVEELLSVSPKLQRVLVELESICKKNEKVLIFTHRLRMQGILKQVIDKRFGLTTRIINGTTHSGTSKSGENQRFAWIQEFQEKPGFNVLILSPQVAGVGLTIVEANHVIHYSRWWNPAIEDQASCRVYRIGQTRDVYVYYPLSVHPEIVTFDQKLDELLQYKQTLRRDFFTPANSLEITGEELFTALVNTGEKQPATRTIIEAKNLASLDWQQFEALIALLYEREGYQVILTPVSNDRGIDVIALKGKQALIIQCKHTANHSELKESALAELDDGFDYYYNQCFGKLNYSVERVCATNASVPLSLGFKASKREITLLKFSDIDKFLRKYRPSYADLYTCENNRISSVNDLQIM